MSSLSKYTIRVKAELDDVNLTKQLNALQKKISKAKKAVSGENDPKKSAGEFLGIGEKSFEGLASRIKESSGELTKLRKHFLGLSDTIHNVKATKLIDDGEMTSYSVSLDNIQDGVKESQKWMVKLGEGGQYFLKKISGTEQEAKKLKETIKKTQGLKIVDDDNLDSAKIKIQEFSAGLQKVRESFEGIGENLKVSGDFDVNTGKLKGYQVTFDKIKDDVKQTETYMVGLDGKVGQVLKGAKTTAKAFKEVKKTVKDTSLSTEQVDANLLKWNDSLREMENRTPKIFEKKEIVGIRTELDGMIAAFNDPNVKKTPEMVAAINAKMTHLKSTIHSTSLETQNLTHDSDDFGSVMAKNIKKVVQWAIATTAIYGTLKQIKEAIQFIKDLNKEMTNIQVVTGMSKNEINGLTQEFNKLALATGSTTIEIAAGSTEWFRAGKTIAETSELMRATMMLSKLGNMESAESTTKLTAALNGFQLGAEDAIGVVDILINLDNQYSTSVSELTEALQMSSSSAQQVGVDFNELASMITVISSTTRRSGSSIGMSMKTMFARLSAIKLGKMFEDDATNINDVEKALSLVNIKLRDSETSFRDMGNVFEDIAVKWDTMNELEQSAVSTAVAGKMYARTCSDAWEFAY